MNVTIEKLVYGGDGLAHSDGNTVFVPFVLPGESVTVRPVERKKKFVRAALAQVLTPSPERVAPACSHFMACGGCHYQHIPYESQLQHKAAILRETLGRIGKVKWEGEIHALASPPLGYRNRAQWKVRWTEDGGEQRGIIGYNRAASAAVISVEQCPILVPALQEALQSLRAAVADGALPATLREIEAFCDGDGAQILLNASFTHFDGSGRRILDALRIAVPSAASILLHHAQKDHFELDGPGFIPYSVGEHSFRVGHLSFFQVNRYLVAAMQQHAVAEERGALALDLFAGVGLFAVPLAQHFERTIAVESNEAAVRDLRANADDAGLKVQAVVGDAARYLSSAKDAPDLVVLDPPRAGIGTDTVAALRKLAPKRITYLSCDPATLARDLAGLLSGEGAGARYALRDVRLFDVFPQTFHIETLVRLELA